MLKDKRRVVERMANNIRLRRQIVREYGAFLRTLFSIGDWFVTLTFRDRKQSSPRDSDQFGQNVANSPRLAGEAREHFNRSVKRYPRDPRLDTWEPDSRYRREPGPPVQDAALREIEHWLLELGCEAAGHKRQEIFDRLADGLDRIERRAFAKKLSKRCIICELYNDPVTTSAYYDIRKIATAAIGWVIAEEFGRAGGRWHVHLIIRGVQHLRRKKWWKRAFVRFGRSRIEPIHE
jgi:hypothetical protein